MKIISGNLKGRTVKGYNIPGTRPTMDRVKESVFGMIQDYVKGSVVLDLFAGSGNYGIEAISNGACEVYFNDINKKCLEVIRENANNFEIIDKCHLLNYDYSKALSYLSNLKIKFDLVFLDPPYNETCLPKVLELLSKHSLLNSRGLIICEVRNDQLSNNKLNLNLIKNKNYGDKSVLIFQKDDI